VNSAIQKESALVIWTFAPRGLVPFASWLHHLGHADAQTEDATQGFNLLCSVAECFKIPEILSYSPDGASSGDAGAVPCDELFGGDKRRGNRFFGEDMLARNEGLLDERWLTWNREAIVDARLLALCHCEHNNASKNFVDAPWGALIKFESGERFHFDCLF
jgi:hypothetical protein